MGLSEKLPSELNLPQSMFPINRHRPTNKKRRPHTKKNNTQNTINPNYNSPKRVCNHRFIQESFLDVSTKYLQHNHLHQQPPNPPGALTLHGFEDPVLSSFNGFHSDSLSVDFGSMFTLPPSAAAAAAAAAAATAAASSSSSSSATIPGFVEQETMSNHINVDTNDIKSSYSPVSVTTSTYNRPTFTSSKIPFPQLSSPSLHPMNQNQMDSNNTFNQTIPIPHHTTNKPDHSNKPLAVNVSMFSCPPIEFETSDVGKGLSRLNSDEAYSSGSSSSGDSDSGSVGHTSSSTSSSPSPSYSSSLFPVTFTDDGMMEDSGDDLSFLTF
jgi:hypothetical protein